MIKELMADVGKTLMETIVFLLPAYIANMAPVLLWRTAWWPALRKPIDRGKKIGRVEIFGTHKTYFGILSAVFGGALVGLIMGVIGIVEQGWSVLQFFGVIILCAWIGLGAIMGDLLESFVKRRLGIRSGEPLWFFDQVDFVIGGWCAYKILEMAGLIDSYPIVGTIDIVILITGVVITPFFHLAANIVAYKMGWKKVWW